MDDSSGNTSANNNHIGFDDINNIINNNNMINHNVIEFSLDVSGNESASNEVFNGRAYTQVESEWMFAPDTFASMPNNNSNQLLASHRGGDGGMLFDAAQASSFLRSDDGFPKSSRLLLEEAMRSSSSSSSSSSKPPGMKPSKKATAAAASAATDAINNVGFFQHISSASNMQQGRANKKQESLSPSDFIPDNHQDSKPASIVVQNVASGATPSQHSGCAPNSSLQPMSIEGGILQNIDISQLIRNPDQLQLYIQILQQYQDNNTNNDGSGSNNNNDKNIINNMFELPSQGGGQEQGLNRALPPSAVTSSATAAAMTNSAAGAVATLSASSSTKNTAQVTKVNTLDDRSSDSGDSVGTIDFCGNIAGVPPPPPPPVQPQAPIINYNESPGFRQDPWGTRYRELIEFQRIFKHCIVPHNYEPNLPLAQWVKRQRNQRKCKLRGDHSTLTPAREAALNRIGFCWDAHAVSWEERWHDLLGFLRRFGHCNVPSTYSDNPKLAVWVKSQRRQCKLWKKNGGLGGSSMTKERFDRLSSIGFDWNPRNL